MSRPQGQALTKRILDRLSVEGKGAIFWDRDLAGFGIRVYPHGRKLYVVQARAFGRSKRVTIGDTATRLRRLLGPQASHRDHLAHQAGQARAQVGAGWRADRRRPRRALRARACRGSLQASDREPLRPHDAQAHRAALGHLPARLTRSRRATSWASTPACMRCPRWPTGRPTSWAHVQARQRLGMAPYGQTPAGACSASCPGTRSALLTREELARLDEAPRAAPAEQLACTHAAGATRFSGCPGARQSLGHSGERARPAPGQSERRIANRPREGRPHRILSNSGWRVSDQAV